MHGILVVMFLLILSAVGMLRATATSKFNQCFPGWAKAEQVTVSCNNIKIAQYCDPGHQSCRTMNKPGVSLEKGSKGVCLNITNCSYDSWSCEAVSYIDHEQQGTNNFTVDVCNPCDGRPTPPTSNCNVRSHTHAALIHLPVTVSESESERALLPEAPSTSSSTGNNESQTDTIAAGVSVPIICLLIFFFILFILYMKKNPKKEPDTELRENLKAKRSTT